MSSPSPDVQQHDVPKKKGNVLVEEIGSNTSSGGSLFARYPILSVVVFASIGLGAGVGLSAWEPPEGNTSKQVTLQWIGLIGDIFIRSLKAVILPLIFVNVAISVVDMMMLGRASTVGIKTVVLYITTTLIASFIGLISVLSFRGLFEQGVFPEETSSFISLGCSASGSLLTEMQDGSLMCVLQDDAVTEASTQFEMLDQNGQIAMADDGFAELSLSETIYEGVFLKLVTENVFTSFEEGNFAAVIICAIVFGVAVGRIMFEKGQNVMNASFVVSFFQEISEILLKIIHWIIAFTPFAVCSLIANAIGSQGDLAGAFSNVGYLILANLVGYLAHFLITDVCFFHFASGRKQNPFTYLRQLIPAQTTALACASSATTLPVTLRCVKATGQVPDDIRNFVCPLGATINMDGSAIYIPCACIWLAILNGITPDVGSYILLIVLATVGSAGTAPVPSAGLVLVITAYNTVFGTTGTPDGFEFVIAIDWFLDRCITALNVTGDAVVYGIIAARTPWEEDVTEETSPRKIEEGSSEDDDDGADNAST